jgi:Flp pilus assembly secretin CpaC
MLTCRKATIAHRGRRAAALAVAAALLGAATASADEPAKAAPSRPIERPGKAIQLPRPAGPPTARSDRATPRDTVTVVLDYAKIIRLPERTQTVIIGNPMIADITVQKNGVVIVTGKTYGVTNLIALDNSGAMLAESMISVQAADESVVTVQRGLERESYSCTPHCQPTVVLGDGAGHFGAIGGQVGTRNTLATQR